MNSLQPTFRWLERGRGEPVVLLHGLLGTMDHWDGTLDALAPLARALAPEVPILDDARAEASVDGLTRHVAMFMEALELPPAVVGGNSLGGHLALELALRYPDRVSGLILTGSSGLFERSFTRGVPHVPTEAFVREKMEEVFYDPALVAIVPMASCFPGQDAKGGDLPPRRECAETWRAPIFAALPRLELILTIGRYAQGWHLGPDRASGLTATVKRWRAIVAAPRRPRILPMPHPSWRNNGWLRKNPWFETELVPALQSEVRALLA